MKKGSKMTEEQKQKMRKPHKGAGVYKRTEYHREITRKGIQKLYDSGVKMGFQLSHYKNSGDKNNNWKGGITPENTKARKSIHYKLWQRSVWERDNFTCQKYGTRGGDIVAHHINNFAEIEELRYAIDNGITLSQKAHLEFHKRYGFKNNTKEQLYEYLRS